MDKPELSVIIPAYNCAHCITDAVFSVYAQTCGAHEIIVVNDGSTDKTREVVSSLGQKVRLLSQMNQGPGEARNLGANVAKGEWLAFLDADDVWLPGKLSKQLEYVRDPSVAVVNCRAKTKQGDPMPASISFDRLWEINDLITSSAIVRRSAFLEVGGFDPRPDLRSAEDYDLWLRLAARGWKIVNCPEDLVLYQPSAESLSNRLEGFASAQIACLTKVGKELQLSDERLRKRLAAANLDFARAAIFARNMALARKFAGRSLKLAVSLKQLSVLVAAHMPGALLDFRRSFLKHELHLRSETSR
jgi:glycosyltransferase involved in cell wall biosynthesis